MFAMEKDTFTQKAWLAKHAIELPLLLLQFMSDIL
jgi:hypothetical protein